MRLKLLFVQILLCGCLYAQVSEPIPPQSIEDSTIFNQTIPIVGTPAIDLIRISREDQILDTQSDIPFRFGIEHSVKYNLKNSGIWTELPDGSRIWRLAIHAPEALSINLIYSDFLLPEKATLHLYNEDKSQILGAFTEFNNKADRKFATALVYGNTCYLEYYEPAFVYGEGTIEISTVVHGYRTIKNNAQLGNSGSCNVDVICSQGNNWREEIRAVGKTISGGGLCSGTLVGNVTGDRRPLFLTANHCGFNSTMVVYWLFERPSCGSGTPNDELTTTGGTLLSDVDGNPGGSVRGADHLLIELSENPADFYNVYFAGWDARGNIPQAVTGIHHPAGDAKMISMDNDPSTSTGYSSSTSISNGTHWRVADWDSGTTEGGSSGSVLFDNSTKRLVGMLSGGGAACGNDAPDWYGKFSYAWNNNGASSAAQRLRDWLDPNNTGTLFIDGYGLDCNSEITNITAGTQGSCDPSTNTYTQQLTIFYSNPPSSGTLIVNEQSFPFGASQQTITLTNLNADGQAVNVRAYFSDEAGCVENVNSLFTAPVACATLSCETFTATDLPLTIDIDDPSQITSSITVPISTIVRDVKIRNLNGKHTWLGDLSFTLTSPNGTTISLIDRECSSVEDFSLDLEDIGLTTFNCPYNDGLSYKPTDSFQNFVGEGSQGNWVLTVIDNASADGGSLDGWSLEICFIDDDCPSFLDITDDYNNEMIIQRAETIDANNTILNSADVSYKASTSITLKPGFMVAAGSAFLATIEDCSSPNTMAPPTREAFKYFTQTSTTRIYPNPFDHQTTIEYALDFSSHVQLQVVDILGRQVANLVDAPNQSAGLHQVIFNRGQLQSGTYFVLLRKGDQYVSKKMILQ